MVTHAMVWSHSAILCSQEQKWCYAKHRGITHAMLWGKTPRDKTLNSDGFNLYKTNPRYLDGRVINFGKQERGNG